MSLRIQSAEETCFRKEAIPQASSRKETDLRVDQLARASLSVAEINTRTQRELRALCSYFIRPTPPMQSSTFNEEDKQVFDQALKEFYPLRYECLRSLIPLRDNLEAIKAHVEKLKSQNPKQHSSLSRDLGRACARQKKVEKDFQNLLNEQMQRFIEAKDRVAVECLIELPFITNKLIDSLFKKALEANQGERACFLAGIHKSGLNQSNQTAQITRRVEILLEWAAQQGDSPVLEWIIEQIDLFSIKMSPNSITAALEALVSWGWDRNLAFVFNWAVSKKIIESDFIFELIKQALKCRSWRVLECILRAAPRLFFEYMKCIASQDRSLSELWAFFELIDNKKLNFYLELDAEDWALILKIAVSHENVHFLEHFLEVGQIEPSQGVVTVTKETAISVIRLIEERQMQIELDKVKDFKIRVGLDAI